MARRFHEHELLDLVEGRMEPERSNALRARLAGEAALAGQIDGMIADRAALRSLPAPALPEDFARDLEPHLPRPMLLQPHGTTRPGEFRRSMHKAEHSRRMVRMALAVCVALAGAAGVYIAASGLLRQRSMNQGEQLTAIDSSLRALPETDATPGPAEVSPDWLRPGSSIHHQHPLLDDMRVAMSSPSAHAALQGDSRTGTAQPAASRLAAESPVTASFALVVQTKDAGAALLAMSSVVAKQPDQRALVANFSFDEARSLAEAWRVAHAGSTGPAPDRIAGTEGAAGSTTRPAANRSAWMRELTMAAREELRRRGKGEGSGAVLAGQKMAAPSFEQQLELSSRGAAYTVAIRAGDLARTMQSLSEAIHSPTALRMLPPTAEIGTSSAAVDTTVAADRWAGDLAAVREAVNRIGELPPDTIIHVPVIVRTER